jgi:hypothetical protein
MPLNAALLVTLRWSVLMGGLVIIVDLGTQAIQQRTAPGPDAIGELSTANLIANIVLFSILGAAVARQTGIFYLAALAGLLASILDGIVVATAASMAPPAGEAMPIDMYLLQNILIGTIPAAVSGFVASLVDRVSGTRPG